MSQEFRVNTRVTRSEILVFTLCFEDQSQSGNALSGVKSCLCRKVSFVTPP